MLVAIIALCVTACGATEAVKTPKTDSKEAKPFKAGVWAVVVNGEETSTYVFTDSMKECIYGNEYTGVPFDYEIEGGSYIFHMGSADDVTKARVEFTDDEHCTIYWDGSGAENVLVYKGTQEETEAETEESTDIPHLFINSEPIKVTAAQSFDNAGVSAFICDAKEKYSFTSSDPDVKWDIYILDEPFTDGARYLSQAKAPRLSGDGALDIEEGKYIYLRCSDNAFTSESGTPSDAVLLIDYAPLD